MVEKETKKKIYFFLVTRICSGSKSFQGQFQNFGVILHNKRYLIWKKSLFFCSKGSFNLLNFWLLPVYQYNVKIEGYPRFHLR